MYTIGADIGSVAVKVVLLEDGEWRDGIIVPTGWNPKDSGSEAISAILNQNDLTRAHIARVVSTGYGRNSIECDERITEITCHAKGAKIIFERGGVRFVLDIGGQDSKAISLDEKWNVSDFLMNDKCAAGTGRFLQNMAVMLECELKDFSALPNDIEPHAISSMCTVFAESEIVGLLAQGVDKQALMLGILDSVASRAEGMLRRVGFNSGRSARGVAFTGGASRSINLAELLERRLGVPLLTSEMSQYAGALGAAEIAFREVLSRTRGAG
ncbi:2-hydroxyglutaryl-CoA dehydratase [Synergistales bacterium]|nr:2-hydroxyglutaryl-CoA dehydratase [Synergistales bacterium]